MRKRKFKSEREVKKSTFIVSLDKCCKTKVHPSFFVTCFFFGSSYKPSFCGDYLVFIHNAEIPTILTWNGDCFVDELNDPYCVDFWAVLPNKSSQF